ncbi:reverse transcriptase domain-containing protein [bacterium]|nr:reverse transcriptase domain-containing protein [bacterium]
MKFLISDAATTRGGDRKSIMVNDVSRAFFEAPIERLVCIELPEEAIREGEEGMVGLLAKSLYGTRDAAANFQKEVKIFLVTHGFTPGVYSPITYYHSSMRIRVLVHGDDFVSSGESSSLKWFKKKLEDRFEIKTTVIGLKEEEELETRILNRIIRVGEAGWEYEPDQRHAELIVRGLGLEKANGVTTLKEDDKAWVEEEEAQLLDANKQREYRRLVARANYLAADRGDIQYSVKELCRSMSCATRGCWRRLKRLGRYLITAPRVVTSFRWQDETLTIDAYSDSDWAGCRNTCRSTSGGVIMRGAHLLKSWSITQKAVSLSSGEAELIVMVKASTEVLGLFQMMKEWGIAAEGSVYVDSSAALGVVGRRGCGKLRHVRVGNLWVQEKRENGELKYQKIAGSVNPADLMTKLVTACLRQRHVTTMGLDLREGRASSHCRSERPAVNALKILKF